MDENQSEIYEEKLLNIVGLTRGRDFEIYDSLFVFPNQQVGHLHTIEAGFENKQTLVLIHGYGSSAVFYYKVIQELHKTFHIYAIDLYGMGSSSRPPITNFEFDHVVDFFVDALELWRVKIGLTDFVLMGHSMGGYLSSQWIRLKNPPIKMLYLLSPAGFTNKDDETLKKETGYFKGLAMNVYDWYLHKNNKNPFNLLVCKEFFIKRHFKGKRIKMHEKEAEAAAKYLSSILDKQESGERAVGVLLRFAKYSNYPICDVLHEIRHTRGFQCPIVVIYGEKDWMDFKHSIEKNVELGLHLDIEFIPDCDHQIILQNPRVLCQKMMEDYEKGYHNIREVEYQ